MVVNRKKLWSRNYRNVALLFALFGILLSLLPLSSSIVQGQKNIQQEIVGLWLLDGTENPDVGFPTLWEFRSDGIFGIGVIDRTTGRPVVDSVGKYKFISEDHIRKEGNDGIDSDWKVIISEDTLTLIRDDPDYLVDGDVWNFHRLGDTRIEQTSTETPILFDNYPALAGEIAYVQDGDIYLLDLATKQTKRLTNGAEAMTGSQIAWSPDGEWLAFASEKAGNVDIYKMRADGSELTPVANDSHDENFPDFSREGDLYFIRIISEGGNQPTGHYIIMKQTTSNEERVIFESNNTVCTPDALRIASDGSLVTSAYCHLTTQISRIDQQGNETDLTPSYFEDKRGTNCGTSMFHENGHMVTSAHTKPFLAFVADADCADPDISDTHDGLFLQDATNSSSEPKLLFSISLLQRISSLNWSADDQQLIFSIRNSDPTPGGLWVIRSQGGQPQQVSDVGESPAWRPVAVPKPTPIPTNTPELTATPIVPIPGATPIPPTAMPTPIPRDLTPIVFVPGYWGCMTDAGSMQRGLGGFARWWSGKKNNLWPGYGDKLSDLLKDNGYDDSNSGIVSCYSWFGNMENASKELRDNLKKTYDNTRKPITIITHSTGALITRYTLRKFSQELRDGNKSIIQDLILVAPPNGGVPYSNYIWEDGDIEKIPGKTEYQYGQEFGPRVFTYQAITSVCKISPPEIITYIAYYYDGEIADIEVLGPEKASEQLRRFWDDYRKKARTCLRRGYEYKNGSIQGPEGQEPLLVWLQPEWYKGAPVNILNNDEDIGNLFGTIQGKIYVLAGKGNKDTVITIKEGNPTTGDGDGTVPLETAGLHITKPEKGVQNIQNERYVFVEYDGVDHGKLLEDAKPLGKISDILDLTNRKSLLAQKPVSQFMHASVASPVNLLVISPSGKRFGVDSTGNFMSEIPDADYGTTDNPLGPKHILILNPEAGEYQYQITPIGEGGHYEFYAFSSISEHPMVADNSTVAKDKMKTYQATYTIEQATQAPDATTGAAPSQPTPAASKGGSCLGLGFILLPLLVLAWRQSGRRVYKREE